MLTDFRSDLKLKERFLNFAKIKNRLVSYIIEKRNQRSLSDLYRVKLSLAEDFLKKLNKGACDAWLFFCQEELDVIQIENKCILEKFSSFFSKATDELDTILAAVVQLEHQFPASFYSEIPSIRSNYIFFLDFSISSLILERSAFIFFIEFINTFFLFAEMSPLLYCQQRQLLSEDRQEYMRDTLQLCPDPELMGITLKQVKVQMDALISSNQLSFGWSRTNLYCVIRDVVGSQVEMPLAALPQPFLPAGFSELNPYAFLGSPRRPPVVPDRHRLSVINLSAEVSSDEESCVPPFPYQAGNARPLLTLKEDEDERCAVCGGSKGQCARAH